MRYIRNIYRPYQNFETRVGGLLSSFLNSPLTLIDTEIIDTEDYDIVPKKHTVERQVREKEQALQELKDRRANYERWMAEQEKSLSTEIDNLKQKLNK